MFITGDIEDNVFKLYPELKMIPEFSDLISEFGVKQASKYIWAIAKTEDPESLLYSSKLKTRRESVEKTYLKESIEWDKGLIKQAIGAYKRECMSLERRALKTWGDKIHESMVWMDDNNVEDLLGGRNSPIKNLDVLMKTYDKYKEKYLADKEETSKNEGGYKASAQESGII